MPGPSDPPAITSVWWYVDIALQYYLLIIRINCIGL